MDTQKEIDVLLRARVTLLVLVTLEEERALEMLKSVCEKRSRSLTTWDLGDGFRNLHNTSAAANSNTRPVTDPNSALTEIDSADNDTVYALLDFHEVLLHYPGAKRKLRAVSQRLKFTRKSIVLITPFSRIPEELRNTAVIVDFPLPDANELDKVLETLLKTPGIRVNLPDADRERLVQAGVGLTASQAQRVFAKAIVSDATLDARDIDLVTTEKKALIKDSRALEFFNPAETPTDVGGLDLLKDWLKLREQAFTKEARDYGISLPRGIALIGIPGTGKSLTAKMIGAQWHMPVVRFDIGAVYGKYYGESEESMRRALQLAETVAPCVLWIDEIEKALSHGDHDDGTSKRVFGSILTWMSEKIKPCFVVATANNVAALPPELLRRGRFDEVFFLDLPTASERKEIFSVHFRKRKRDAKAYDLDALAEAARGFVGAEIEQVIVDSMFSAFSEKRDFTTADILKSIKRTVPLSQSQREVIANLQTWLVDGRAVPASTHGKNEQGAERLKGNFGFGA